MKHMKDLFRSVVIMISYQAHLPPASSSSLHLCLALHQATEQGALDQGPRPLMTPAKGVKW